MSTAPGGGLIVALSICEGEFYAAHLANQAATETLKNIFIVDLAPTWVFFSRTIYMATFRLAKQTLQMAHLNSSHPSLRSFHS